MQFFKIWDKILQVNWIWGSMDSNTPLSTVPFGWLLKTTGQGKILRHKILVKVDYFTVLKPTASQMIEDNFWNPCINNKTRRWAGREPWKITYLPFGKS